MKLLAALRTVIANYKKGALTEADLATIKKILWFGSAEGIFGSGSDKFTDEEKEKQWAKRVVGILQREKQRFDSFPDPFPIYRAICVPSTDDIDTKDLGASWTYEADSADCFGYPRLRGDPFYLETMIPKNKVLWLESLARQIWDEDENEINPSGR